MGKALKVGRPKTYQGLMTMGEDNLLSNTVASVLINGIMNAPLKGEKITFCTRVLCFKGIVKDLNIENEDIYNEIGNDIKLECEKYGKVCDVFMPRKDVDENDVAGMGNAYVLFDSIDDAKNARKNLCCRRFNNKLVRIMYCEEEKFEKKNFEDVVPIDENNVNEAFWFLYII